MAARQTTLTTSGNVDVGDTGWGQGGTWVLQVSGTWTGTIKAQGIIKETADLATPLTLGSNAVDLAIVNATSGATVAGGTGTTANGIFFVRADGLSLRFNYAAGTGSPILTYYPVAA
jgi:hypothetical protein